MNSRLVLARLTDVAGFAHWQEKIRSVPGWLHDMEGFLLHLLAAEGPGVGAIVEIGSYMGRSTSWLASGAKAAGREKVTAVDHFRGSPEHQPGGRVESKVIVQEGTTYNRFQQNLQRLGLLDSVTPRVGTSEEAVQGWTQPIRLLFIDADHSYEESRKDFELWSPFVIRQGLICFHDINAWPGVTRFYQELMKNNSDYQDVIGVHSIRVIQKRNGGPPTEKA